LNRLFFSLKQKKIRLAKLEIKQLIKQEYLEIHLVVK